MKAFGILLFTESIQEMSFFPFLRNVLTFWELLLIEVNPKGMLMYQFTFSLEFAPFLACSKQSA